MIGVFAPVGIGEIEPGSDLAATILHAVAADPAGPLAVGDIVVVTSKIVSKAEGRTAPAAEREAVLAADTVGTVARRGPTAIVRTPTGLALAAAGVDVSNVAFGQVLRLPVDPDRSAEDLRRALSEQVGGPIGVVVSDTAGRPWRLGQTDQAIGAAGIRVLEDYVGRHDPYGNELRVTAVALADELAAAGDLVKQKLTGRPVAVVRGLAALVVDGPGPGAATLVRRRDQDLFAYGTREAVLAAVAVASGRSAALERWIGLEGAALTDAVLAETGATGAAADLLRDLLRAAAYPEPAPTPG